MSYVIQSKKKFELELVCSVTLRVVYKLLTQGGFDFKLGEFFFFHSVYEYLKTENCRIVKRGDAEKINRLSIMNHNL